jgi:hypothetical protein
MNIEFNPNNVGKPTPPQPAARQDATPPARDEAAFQNTVDLENKLRNIPLVRPERVERAKGLVTNVQYPPDEILVGLANLLAMHLE